eukprot:COSAG01_NODE_70648_length_258_cov_0.641509_1_plen_57_part_01
MWTPEEAAKQEAALPYKGDVQAAMKQMDRPAIRAIMEFRGRKEGSDWGAGARCPSCR